MKIVTEEDYNKALEEMYFLMSWIERYEDLLEPISIAIADYEDIHYPMDKPGLWTRIKFRLSMKYKWLGWLG